MGAKIIVSWNAYQGDNVPAYLYIRAQRYGVPVVAINTSIVSELKSRYMRVNTVYSPVSQNFKYPLLQKMYLSIRKLEQVKDITVKEYQFTKTGGPTALPYVTIGALPVQTDFNPSTMNCVFQAKLSVTYYCRLWNRDDYLLGA